MTTDQIKSFQELQNKHQNQMNDVISSFKNVVQKINFTDNIVILKFKNFDAVIEGNKLAAKHQVAGKIVSSKIRATLTNSISLIF